MLRDKLLFQYHHMGQQDCDGLGHFQCQSLPTVYQLRHDPEQVDQASHINTFGVCFLLTVMTHRTKQAC